MGNGPIIFQNTHVKSYYHYIKNADISYSKTVNDLAEIRR